MFNQSINLSFNKSIFNQSINSIHHSINQSSINPSIHQLANQSISHSINNSINHSIIQSINHSIHQSANQSFNQSINKSFNQLIVQLINQSFNQSIYVTGGQHPGGRGDHRGGQHILAQLHGPLWGLHQDGLCLDRVHKLCTKFIQFILIFALYLGPF